MKLIRISQALRNLKKLSDEIRYADCFGEKQFTSGLIAFRPTKKSNPKQINHTDEDVVCHVIKGSGRLRIGGTRFPVRPGPICPIPTDTRRDLAAGKSEDLI